MATETVFEAKKVEEKYLAERTFQWLEGLTGDKLSGYGLGLGEVLRNGKVLKKVANIIEKSASGSSSRLSKGELTEERKGFQAILDVDYFLSCCRSLGLKDHQLFNASDVTTCGDLLRVCRTVRSLSLSCREKGIQTPIFETDKQQVEARRRSMSREATNTKVAALKTLDQLKDKLETKEEKGDKANMGGKAITALSVVAAGIIFFLRPKTYVVRKGDTLSSVARRSRGKVSLKTLKDKNPQILNKDRIHPSQKINI